MNAKQLEAQRKHTDAVTAAVQTFDTKARRLTEERDHSIRAGERMIAHAKDVWNTNWNRISAEYDEALEQAWIEFKKDWETRFG